MRQIAVLVEGLTEERVIAEVLAPAALARDVVLTPIVVRTSAGHRGGGSWGNYEIKLRALLKQPQWEKVGLLIDYYGYPVGAPGRAPGPLPSREALTAALLKAHPQAVFAPLIVPHESEAWVLAAIDAGAADGQIRPAIVSSIRDAVAKAGGAERVNSRPEFAPSKRLLSEYPKYLKTVEGPQWIAEAGLDAVLQRCPALAAWWKDLLH